MNARMTEAATDVLHALKSHRRVLARLASGRKVAKATLDDVLDGMAISIDKLEKALSKAGERSSEGATELRRWR